MFAITVAKAVAIILASTVSSFIRYLCAFSKSVNMLISNAFCYDFHRKTMKIYPRSQRTSPAYEA